MVATDLTTAIRGRRILVVEDEYMIAEEISEVLAEAGADVLGPISSVGEALGFIEGGSRIDGALLDVNVGSRAVWPVVEVLLAKGVPMVLTTGYDASAIPRAYAHLPRCEKPSTAWELTRALVLVLPAGV